jgi:catechol 2,3-dioxygenase-like lactoylglutathione lyase family enzyme
MGLSPRKMNVITVFAENLAEAKAFYEKVLGLEVLGEENEFGPSVVFRLGTIMINLAHVTAGPDFDAPGAVAPRGMGARVVLPAAASPTRTSAGPQNGSFCIRQLRSSERSRSAPIGGYLRGCASAVDDIR